MDAGKEITGQIGHGIIDNTLVESEGNGIEIEAEKIPENYAKKDIKKIVKGSLKNASGRVEHKITRKRLRR